MRRQMQCCNVINSWYTPHTTALKPDEIVAKKSEYCIIYTKMLVGLGCTRQVLCSNTIIFNSVLRERRESPRVPVGMAVTRGCVLRRNRITIYRYRRAARSVAKKSEPQTSSGRRRRRRIAKTAVRIVRAYRTTIMYTETDVIQRRRFCIIPLGVAVVVVHCTAVACIARGKIRLKVSTCMTA